ncbi:MAG: hypothetical protein ACJ75B_16030 [Flavisolibacter sp.]|jgi:hypothetical protein
MTTVQHLCALAIVTVTMGLIYTSVQQSYRTAANDPQSIIAERIKEDLEKGRKMDQYFSDTLDLEKSRDVFVLLCDSKGRPLRGTGYLKGQLPVLPVGLFDHAVKNKSHWVSWQPQQNVRMALGILSVHSPAAAFLAIGRSLDDTEERISKLGSLLLVGWFLCVGIVLINWLILRYGNKHEATFSATGA